MISILSCHGARRSYEGRNDSPNDNDDQNDSPRNDKLINDAPFNKPHTLRMARTVTIPNMSQEAIPVVTKASGLVYIKPKLLVLTKYHARMANGIHEVRPNVKFELVLANFPKTPQRLLKGMTIAYAKRNPLAILTVPDEVSMKLEAVLNIPFTTTTANDSTNNEATDAGGPDEPKNATDWQDTIELWHIENDETRTKIITMLTKHEDMWTTGRLGEITATEHRITLETGTKPTRSMSYRQSPAMRTKAEEIRRMRVAGVIEPATSEWASPIVLVPKKDGSLRFCVDYRRLNAKMIPTHNCYHELTIASTHSVTRRSLRHSVVTQDTSKCPSLRKIAIRPRLRRTSERLDTHGCPSVYATRLQRFNVLSISFSVESDGNRA